MGKRETSQHSEVVIPSPERYRGEWKNEFSTKNPLHVEIGIGKGQFITGMAENHQSFSFIGIEMMESIIVTALDKVLAADIDNVRLLNCDAKNLLSIFAENEIDRIYLNFSDPWPKNRHEKRRLTYKGFLDLYKKVLKPGGEIHLKTDNQGLFDYSLESFAEYGLEVKNVERDLHNSDVDGNIMTEYEQKFSEKGHPIYRCESRVFMKGKVKEMKNGDAESITIRPWQETDLPLLKSMNTEEMWEHLGGPESGEKVLERHQRYLEHDPGRTCMYVIMIEGQPGGSIGYWEKKWLDRDVFEVGWMVLP